MFGAVPKPSKPLTNPQFLASPSASIIVQPVKSSKSSVNKLTVWVNVGAKSSLTIVILNRFPSLGFAMALPPLALTLKEIINSFR